MTDALEKLHADLAEVGRKVGYVQKDGKNSFHGYRYATAEAVLGKVNEALFPKGIAVSSDARLERFETTDKGYIAVVRCELTFVRGEATCSVAAYGCGSDSGDKAVMKGNTAALKYAVASAFLISWGDDPEADSSTDADAAFSHAMKELAAAVSDEEIKAVKARYRGTKFSKEQVRALSAAVANKALPQ